MNLDDIRIHFRIGSVQHKMLSLIAKRDYNSTELRKDTGATIRIERVREILHELKGLKLISVGRGGDHWAITTEGLHVSVLLGAVPATSVVKRSKSEKRAEMYERPNYEPKELGFTCLRPGAYDAFLLPSRIGNELHYPNARKTTTD
jgi:hypothetical protein